jgi:hypothetical protein
VNFYSSRMCQKIFWEILARKKTNDYLCTTINQKMRVKFPQAFSFLNFFRMYVRGKDSFEIGPFSKDERKLVDVSEGYIGNGEKDYYISDDYISYMMMQSELTEDKNAKLRSLRKNVLDVFIKNREAIIEAEAAMVNYMIEYTIIDPPIYLALKSGRSDEKYITAKTLIPQLGGFKKEVRIYLGKADDFIDPTTNEELKKIAKIQMIELLKEKRKRGEI